jgi:hypothetical protein
MKCPPFTQGAFSIYGLFTPVGTALRRPDLRVRNAFVLRVDQPETGNKSRRQDADITVFQLTGVNALNPNKQYHRKNQNRDM